MYWIQQFFFSHLYWARIGYNRFFFCIHTEHVLDTTGFFPAFILSMYWIQQVFFLHSYWARIGYNRFFFCIRTEHVLDITGFFFCIRTEHVLDTTGFFSAFILRWKKKPVLSNTGHFFVSIVMYLIHISHAMEPNLQMYNIFNQVIDYTSWILVSNSSFSCFRLSTIFRDSCPPSLWLDTCWLYNSAISNFPFRSSIDCSKLVHSVTCIKDKTVHSVTCIKDN
jgi:hypothetical protein